MARKNTKLSVAILPYTSVYAREVLRLLRDRFYDVQYADRPTCADVVFTDNVMDFELMEACEGEKFFYICDSTGPKLPSDCRVIVGDLRVTRSFPGREYIMKVEAEKPTPALLAQAAEKFDKVFRHYTHESLPVLDW